MNCYKNLAALIGISIIFNHIECYDSFDEYNDIIEENMKLLPTNCGQPRLAQRIVGGKDAYSGQFPWMARLAFGSKNEESFLCGGALISEYYVVTAAHCLYDREWKELQFVRLGETISSGVYCGHRCPLGVQDIPVNSVIIQGGFDDVLLTNDIALIKLARKAKFTEYVVPICLPHILPKENYQLSGNVQLAGWGETNVSESFIPDHLKYVILQVVNIKQCKRIYGHQHLVTAESQYCVGKGDGKDTCDGDSGGPLMKSVVLDGIGRRTLLFGVVSYGVEECGSTAAIYTKIPYFLDWILINM